MPSLFTTYPVWVEGNAARMPPFLQYNVYASLLPSMQFAAESFANATYRQDNVRFFATSRLSGDAARV